MITGSVYINLSQPTSDEDHYDRHKLVELDHCPDMATVVIYVGARRFVTYSASTYIRRHSDRLRIDLRADDPAIVEKFLDAIRSASHLAVA